MEVWRAYRGRAQWPARVGVVRSRGDDGKRTPLSTSRRPENSRTLTSAHVSPRHPTSCHVISRQLTSAHVSSRQLTSSHVSPCDISTFPACPVVPVCSPPSLSVPLSLRTSNKARKEERKGETKRTNERPNEQYGRERCGAVGCGAVRCGAVRCGAVRCGGGGHRAHHVAGDLREFRAKGQTLQSLT